jgi:hypothetical protein
MADGDKIVSPVKLLRINLDKVRDLKGESEPEADNVILVCRKSIGALLI